MNDNLQHDLTAWRRKLHAAAELSGQEYNTAGIIAAALAACSPDQVLRNVGGRGVLALFEGSEPGPSVLLRADMDALPIREVNDFSHCSLNEGVSHKCGHDGHAAVMLGVARLLAGRRPSRGRVYLLFQPAEETGGGARAVLDDPAVAEIRPDAVFAFHNLPGYPLGQVVVRQGSFTAAVKSMIITLQGKPAHAAEPEHGINPALAMAELLQQAAGLSNNCPERDDFVLVTPVHANLGEIAYGTSAGYGEVHFTLRSWSQGQMRQLEKRLLGILDELAARHWLAIRHSWTEEFHACENDTQAVKQVSRVARQLSMTVSERPMPFKWGEDFGLFTQRFPGALFGIGAGEDHPALHHADYDFPDKILSGAAQLCYQLAIDMLV